MTVQDVLNQVYADIQTNTVQSTVAIPYVNRIIQDLAKWSRWKLLRAPYLYFLTQPGITDYWIGAPPAAAGSVDTGLNITDIYRIDPGSVFDFSNIRKLGPAQSPLLSFPNTLPDATYRPGRPQQFLFDPQNPTIMRIFPAPDNLNTFRPQPGYVPLSTTTGGSLSSRTYYVAATFTDSTGGESTPSKTRQFAIPSGQLLYVFPSFTFPISRNDTNQSYTGFHVYAGTSASAISRQTTSPISFGTAWTEPTTGLISGAAPPTNNTLVALNGYLIGFRYFRTLTRVSNLTDTIPFPEPFLHVIAAGTAMYLARTLDRQADIERFKQEYLEGRVSLIRDWNLMPTGPRFIHPDPTSAVTQVIVDPLWLLTT